MTTKRRRVVAGSMLAGAILLGTAGLAAAQDPTTTPRANPAWGGGGMMDGQMGAGAMAPELYAQMDATHSQRLASGGANYAQMSAMHAQHHPTR